MPLVKVLNDSCSEFGTRFTEWRGKEKFRYISGGSGISAVTAHFDLLTLEIACGLLGSPAWVPVTRVHQNRPEHAGQCNGKSQAAGNDRSQHETSLLCLGRPFLRDFP